MQEFKDLKIWGDSKDFCLFVYEITSKFPQDEKYAITSQLRRAASSIGANIAEGCGRSTNKDFARFLHISMGSLKECEHFLIISKELKYLSESDFTLLLGKMDHMGKMLNNLLKRVKTKN